MNQVTVTMSAEDARAVAAWRRQQQLTEQYLANLKRINEESKKNEGSLAGMVSKGSAELVKFAVAATGIGSAIAGVMAIANQLKREYENMVAKQRGARDAQLGIAEAQREAGKALLAGDKTLSLDGLQERVASISKSTGADQAAIYNAVASALGSKPDGVTDKNVLDAAEIAAKISPTNPGGLETNLTALMSQRAATGAAFEDIAGYQMRLKALSPTKSEEAFARNIAPAIGKGMAFGTGVDEQSALLAYFGNKMGDTEGMVTSNAVTNFEKQIFEATAGKVDGGTIDRLKWLQSDAGKKQRKKFLGPLDEAAKKGKDGAAFGIVGEAKAFTTMLGLIKGDDINQLEAVKTKVGTTVGSGAFYQDTIAQVDSLALQRNARSERMINAAAQNIQAQDIRGGRGAISREGLMKILQTTGATDITQKLALAKFEAITGFGGDEGWLGWATKKLGLNVHSPGGADDTSGALVESLMGLSTDLSKPQATGRKVAIPVYNEALKNVVTGQPTKVGTRIVDEMRPATEQDRATSAQLRELATLLKEVFREVKVEPKVNIVNDAERPKAVPSAKLGRRD